MKCATPSIMVLQKYIDDDSSVKSYVASVREEWKNSKQNIWNDAVRGISKCAKKNNTLQT